LKTDESRPAVSIDTNFTEMVEETYDLNSVNEIIYSGTNRVSGKDFQGSLEYYVIKQDLSQETDRVVKTSVFPILPIGVSRIHQERLVLSEKTAPSLTVNNLGKTVFF